jgi:hypothetical protein
MLRRPFQLVNHHVLALIPPMEQKHIPEQRAQLFARSDALLVVSLHEQLDVTREREHAPRALAEHVARDVVRVRHPGVTGRHARRDHGFHATEELLVLQLFAREAHESLKRSLIAQDVVARLVEHLCADEALHESEQVGVRPSLHLTEEASLAVGEERQSVDQGQAVREEAPRMVELTVPHQIPVDLPFEFSGGLHASGVARRAARIGMQFGNGGIHEGSLWFY